MATYAIGDVQGCYLPLMQLLDIIQFDPAQDTLWFTGDLVNRGPQSLAVLRFIRDLGDKHRVVLGNHDLHLLAVASGQASVNDSDTLNYILQASDKDALVSWLQKQPLLVHDDCLGYAMSHAGLAPQWTIVEAKAHSDEIHDMLQSDNANHFFAHMYGNQPDVWSDELVGVDRWRCIVNYFTRMRYCYADGRLDLNFKGQVKDRSKELIPWFDINTRANKDTKIIFGHWAALNGQADTDNVFALDTGCVWGNRLTAMRLEDEMRFSTPCS